MAHSSSVTVLLFLPCVFSLSLYLGLEMERGERQFFTPSHLPDAGGNVGKRVRLTRKTRPGGIFSQCSGSGAFNAEEMEKIALPLPPEREGGVRWACLAIFFLDLGVDELFAPGTTSGTCLRTEQA